MKAEIKPINSASYFNSFFSLKREDVLVIRSSKFSIFIRIFFPLAIGGFLIISPTINADHPNPIPKIIAYPFALIPFIIGLLNIYVLITDKTVFNKALRKVYLDRCKYTGAYSKVYSFSDVNFFQVIKYKTNNFDNDDITRYELNIVFINEQRISLMNGHRINIIKNARKVSSFMKKPVKAIKHI